MTHIVFDRRAIPAGAIMGTAFGAGKWPLRTFRWPQRAGASPRGSLLFLGGRGDFIEKYLETFGHFHDTGWHITSFDWRGQGGSGRLSPNRNVGHAQSFSPWINDLATVWDRLLSETPGPHIVIAHSMGGHLALRAMIERRIVPDTVVLIAPMLGFDTWPLPLGFAKWFAERMCRWGPPERAAWKANEKPAVRPIPRHTLLTSDLDRYDDEMWWTKKMPELALGPPSWAWVAEAYRSMILCSDPAALATVGVPVLLIGTDGDKLVSPSAIRNTAANLPHSELKMFDKQVAHEILRERDEVRTLALLAIDVFLNRNAPPTHDV
jgi:lysophospholipase